MSYFFHNWPAVIRWPFEHTFWPADRRKITMDELVYGWTDPDGTEHHPGLNSVAVDMPGIANAWPMPIENRTNMLSTGIKTPVGIRSPART